jgi:hypothetical protein
MAGVGCANVGLLGALHRQAAFDLDCPETEIRTVELGSFDVQAAGGCSHKATYVLVNNSWEMRTRDNLSIDAPEEDAGTGVSR